MDKCIRIKCNHSKDCFIKPNKFMWSFMKAYYGNHAGNEIGYTHHRWLLFQCNNPKCSGRAIVEEDRVSELIVENIK